MTHQGPEIPYLLVNQRIRDWRKLYEAATAGIEEAQRVGYIPLYIGGKGRDVNEKEIGQIVATKTTLKEALDELESLIDGPPSRMDLYNEVMDLKPKS